TYPVHSTLLIAAVWTFGRFLRSASARETLWKLALVAPLVTATMQVSNFVPQATPARISIPAFGLRQRQLPLSNAAAPAAAPTSVAASESGDSHRRTPDLALALWAAGAALLLLRLIAGRILLARALRDRVDLLREHDRLARLRAAMSCRPLVRLTESSAVGSPIALSGWEIVVLRATFARLSDEQKDTILAHEIAHLVRRDPLWLLGSELLNALLFVQPLNRLAQKKMKECAEFLCDDLAVVHTGNPRALAETLAELATSFTPAPRAVAAMAEGGSNLMARVSRVLDPHGHRERPLRLAARIAIAATVVGALAAFAPGIGPARHEPGSMHFTEGVLSRTFDGPEGYTNVRFNAKDFDVAEDASWFRFTSRAGFARIRHTAAAGPAREIDMTPGRDLQPVVHYRVGGVEQPWSEDARRIVLSAFRAEKAYARESAAAIVVTPRQRRADAAQKLRTWDADVHYTGTRDDVPVEIVIRAAAVRYDLATGDVFFDEGASLYVAETVGTTTRTFTRNARELAWSGTYGRTEVSSWLADILRKQAGLPASIARSMGRE